MKKSIIFLALCILASYISSAQSLCFPSNKISVGTAPYSVTSADFNGDSKIDMATANRNSNNVSILLGDGLGSFSAVTNFTAGGNPYSIASADFNGDGKIDLVTANESSNNVSILLGNGLGSFSAATNFAVGSSPWSVTSADFNGDGNIDLATANLFSNNVSVLLGNGLGSFSAATNFTVGTQARSVASSDFNGDGKIDLATANGTNVSVMLGNGLGGFSAATNFWVGTTPFSVKSADFNGDGKMDLVTANGTANNVSVLLGNGLGSFSAATNFTVGTNPYSVTSADFNGDGKMDLATANFNSNNTSILLGNGLGSFSAVTNFTAGTNPTFATSADFNGDGKMDLATANATSNNVWVVLGNGLGSFSAATNVTVGANPYSVTRADFNGDGKMDLATANAGSNNVSILLGNGLGGFSAATNFTVGVNPYSVASADFNGDGKMDLVTANYGSNNVSVRLGNGTGGLGALTNFTVGTQPLSVVSADFNGDGKMDLATANLNSNNVSILLGNGLGGFSTATNFTIGGSPYSIISEDFNADGKRDFATVNGTSNNVSVRLGNGLGGFSAATNFTVGSSPRSVTSGDFNGDGKIDLATANFGSSNVSILIGNGLGSFSAVTNFSVGANPHSVTSADFNGDGKMDLATANGNLNKVYVLLGNGLGSFSVSTNFSVGTGAICVTSADFNGDGKMDLATANEGANDVTVLLGVIFNVSNSQTDVSCYGGNNGTAMVTVVSGGNSPYSYSWSTLPTQSTATATNLTPGNYTVTVSDINGCINTKSVTITQPTVISISTIITTITCYGGNNGAATATVSGGTSPYSYSWNTLPVQSTATATNLTAGNYTATITDAKGCIKTASATITQPNAISISTIKTGITCYGGNNGTATATVVSGGTFPYSYLWNSLPTQSSATATNLTAGNYTVTVTDAIGCVQKATVIITQPPALYATVSSSDNSKCSGVCNGLASVSSVINGTPPYTYQWDAASNNQTTATASSLCQGIYTVTVKDANLCSVTPVVQVNMVSVEDPNIYLTNLAAVDQINVSPSFAAYYNYNLPSTISPNASNPRNFVDPGKKARFKVECKNEKTNGQSIVSGICKVRTNNPYITITDSSSALNNIGYNNKAWSADEFEINIAPNTPPGTNAYIDFIVQESGQNYSTSCIAIPITPLVYSTATAFTIDDDNNPDSQGNDNDICEPNETIEYYPLLDNISTLNAEYVRGRLENLDNLSYINIWNNVPGVGTTVYDATWWNYAFGQPQTINSYDFFTTPEYDFVFDYNNTSTTNNFKLYMVMAGGFNLFSGTALSLVQWSLPYTFNSTGVISVSELESESEKITVNPNPSSAIFKINSSFNLKDSPLKVYNTQGQTIFESKQFVDEIDLSHQPKGIYFLQLKSEEKIITRKIIVQ